MFGTEIDAEKEFALESIRGAISELTMLSYFDIEYDIVLLNRIINSIEKHIGYVEEKYTDVDYIETKLYHLKTMIKNMHIFNSNDIRKEVNEIIEYANKHLV